MKSSADVTMDEIVDDVREIRDQFAARFGYDIQRIFAEFQRLDRERQTGIDSSGPASEDPPKTPSR